MDKKIYFASDFHLGSPNIEESHKREKIILEWLCEIEKDAKAIYLLGDVFDFWFEYKKVIPKGFVRFLGKLAQIIDNGIEVHLIVGNHDLWIDSYLNEEIGLKIHHNSIIIEEQSKKIYIGHGDGLGEGDYFYKFLKKIFISKTCKWLFSQLHPDLALSIAHKWSRSSRKNKEDKFISEDKEILFGFCKKMQKINPVDYYVFGHRHIPMNIRIDSKSEYFNAGDWISNYSYVTLHEGVLSLKKRFENKKNLNLSVKH